MWFSFFLCILACVVVLYLPGFFLFRCFSLDRPTCVACAPLAGVAFVSLIPIANALLGIRSSVASVLLPLFAICLVPYFAWRIAKRGTAREVDGTWRWKMLVWYAAVGIVVCVYMFIKPLDGADSFYGRADNATHLNMVRYFIESGHWSSLSPTTGDLAYEPDSFKFYPAGWHCLAALASMMAQADPIVAINATNAVISGLVYPLSMFALMDKLFGGSKLSIAIGAVASLAFACFPWSFFIKGPLVSNLLSYALLPATLALFIWYIRAGVRSHWKGMLASGLICGVALALSQANALFCAYIFIGSYLSHRAFMRWDTAKKRIPALLGTVVLFVAVWFALMQVPYLASIVNFDDHGGLNFTPVESIFATLTLELYANQPPQLLLALVSFVGIIAALRAKRLWLIFPPLYMLVAYGVSRCTDAYIRSILCGFWYNDPWRMADCAAIFLGPIVVFGLTAIIRFVVRIARRIRSRSLSESNRTKGSLTTTRAVSIVVLVLFVAINFFPTFPNPATHKREYTPFGFMRDRIAREYSTDRDHVYSAKEKEFVERVKEAIPEDALVINSPEDGSFLAYGVNDLNTYLRHYSVASLTDDAEVIRKRLADLATDPEVQQAVNNTSAQYVLLLDQGISPDEGKWLMQTNEKTLARWDGINRITDDTPGFETVLADDDMRLYKIVGAGQ